MKLLKEYVKLIIRESELVNPIEKLEDISNSLIDNLQLIDGLVLHNQPRLTQQTSTKIVWSRLVGEYKEATFNDTDLIPFIIMYFVFEYLGEDKIKIFLDIGREMGPYDSTEKDKAINFATSSANDAYRSGNELEQVYDINQTTDNIINSFISILKTELEQMHEHWMNPDISDEF